MLMMFLKNLMISALLLITLPAFAHFHYAIDVTNNLQVNKNNQLTGFRYSWIYNEEVSQMMLDDNPDLSAFGEGLMEDLEALEYFTQIRFNGKPVETSKVTSYHLQKINQGEKARLKLDFTLPLKQPINMAGINTLTIEHSDPSGSAVVTYRNNDHILLGIQLKSACESTIQNKNETAHGEAPQLIQINCKI